MATLFGISTPGEDGRVHEYILIPPPGPAADGLSYVLVWNSATFMPEWRTSISLPGGPSIGAPSPLATDSGDYLLTDTGDRLVGLIPA
jgi:hypothetical protein